MKKKNLRSKEWFDNPEDPGLTALYLERYLNYGLKKKDLKIVKKLVPTYYFKNIEGENLLKKTTWFLFDFIGDLNSPLVPETKENITHCEWVTIDNIDKIFKNTHERIKYIIDLFLVDLKNSKKITT